MTQMISSHFCLYSYVQLEANGSTSARLSSCTASKLPGIERHGDTVKSAVTVEQSFLDSKGLNVKCLLITVRV